MTAKVDETFQAACRLKIVVDGETIPVKTNRPTPEEALGMAPEKARP